MIKTPKILQIAIVSVAILVAGFIGFSMLFGSNPEDISKFLNSKDAIKKFKTQNGKRQAGQDKISPLIQEAKKFALYLDPPPPPMPIQQNNNNNQNVPNPIMTRPIIPIVKFDLLATIVNVSNPAESRAMIDLPGTGQIFVKQGQQAGNSTIKEIKNGSIIVVAGERTEELLAKIPPVPSLVKDSPNNIFKMFPDLKTDGAHLSDAMSPEQTSSVVTPVTNLGSRFSNPAASAVGTLPSALGSSRPMPMSRSSRRPTPPTSRISTSRTAPPRLTAEQEKKAMDELMAELAKMKNTDGSNAGEDLEKIMNAVNAENNAATTAPATPVENIEQKTAPNKPE